VSASSDDVKAITTAIGDRPPTAAEARALCDALGITDHIRGQVAEWPLTDTARHVLRQFGADLQALRARRAEVGDERSDA
jgi:hypothetical protein